jgi:DNA (cytosine-5)-methyltransferase 1
MKINQLDLFSGIGGFHLGFERAGYEVTSYFSEIDQHAIAVYKHQFPTSTYVGSVTNVRGADLPRIDLITFGSPCQDFSLAGKRKGMEGERSSLILEAIRLIRECQPRVFVWENVKGTFSSNAGEDLAAILQEFANIGGYRLEWQLLNTSWFLPQNRERIYLVGYLAAPKRNWRGVFPIREASESNSKLECAGEAVTKCLTARGQEGHAGMQLIKVKQIGTKLDSNGSQGLFDGYRIRRLTPIECERLQGFPDDHTSFGNYDGVVKPMSNTQRYKQCGNAVTVDVVAAVAKNCLPLFKTNQQ